MNKYLEGEGETGGGIGIWTDPETGERYLVRYNADGDPMSATKLAAARPTYSWPNAPTWSSFTQSAEWPSYDKDLQALIVQAGQAGQSDIELDKIRSQYQQLGWAALNRQAYGAGSQPTQDQWFYNLLSPEQQEQWRQMQLGGAPPWQREQWEAQQAQAAQAYQLQQRQFAWQQEQAARAEEERRKQRAVEWNVRPSTWPELWAMYGGEGLPAGYTAPELEAGMNQPSWIAALQKQPQVAAQTSVPTKLPLGSLLRGAMEGKAAPTQAFAMPPGAGPLPSAQYLSKMPGSAVEGLGAAYESEWGLSWEDMVQMIQRSLPQRSAGQVGSLGALRR